MIKELIATYGAYAIFTYWIPAAIVLAVYLVRTFLDLKEDSKRAKDNQYHREVTLGSLIVQLIIAFTPIVNVIALVFDCMGDIFKSIFKALDVPIIPRKKS